MKHLFFLIALLAWSLAACGQSDRVKTVEVPDSASQILFDTTGNGYLSTDVQGALEELDFDAGNILYVATTGNDATGVIGYPNKPYTPIATLDSVKANLVNWYYPGVYNIGVGQDFVNSTWNRNTPYLLHAPNSTLNFVGSGSGHVFNDNGETLINTESILHINKVILDNINLIDIGRNGASNRLKLRVRQLTKLGSSGTIMTTRNHFVNIDSAYIENAILNYTYPSIDNTNNLIDIGYLYTQGARTTFAVQTTGDSVTVEARIGYMDHVNGALVYTNEWATRSGQYGSDILKIGYLKSTDNLSITDTSPSSLVSYSNVQSTNGQILLRYNDPTDVGYRYILDINELDSDKCLDIRGVANNTTYDLRIGKGLFNKTKGLQIAGFSSNNAVLNINFEEVTSTVNSVVSVLSADATSRINLKGKMTTSGSSLPVIYSVEDLYLENVELYNDGTYPCIEAPSAINVYVLGDLYMNSDSIDPDVKFIKIEYGYTNPTNSLSEDTQAILDSIFNAIPKQSAQFFQETTRQYAFSSGDTVAIDTLSNYLLTDSISQDTGYIRNISSDTMRWQVSYNLFKDSDEDALSSFFDLTTDGTDSPEAIPGSRATTEQSAVAGIPAPGPSFFVDVPPGDAIRLMCYSIPSATFVDVVDLSISVLEVYRE